MNTMNQQTDNSNPQSPLNWIMCTQQGSIKISNDLNVGLFNFLGMKFICLRFLHNLTMAFLARLLARSSIFRLCLAYSQTAPGKSRSTRSPGKFFIHTTAWLRAQ